jgi:tRNA dimethylallyltransferase
MASRIWLIAGPTASGKSALALRLAHAVHGEIVGADALQIYRDLPILTASPGPTERKGVPHHLVGTVDGAIGWSVGRWLTAANIRIAKLQEAGVDVIVVGGTGLYLEALVKGIAEIPPVSSQVRVQATEEFAQMGEAAFRARLAGVDPAAADRILPGDRQRLVRAWEVFVGSGRPLSDWRTRRQGGLAPGSWRGVRLMPPREALYSRCDARYIEMVHGGAIDEALALASRQLEPSLPVCKAVGLRPVLSHLAGLMSLKEAIAAGQQETRNYVKRQEVWLRGRMANWPAITDIDPDDQWRSFLALNPDLTASRGHGSSVRS